jgi:hypothetical protein
VAADGQASKPESASPKDSSEPSAEKKTDDAKGQTSADS